MEMSLQKGTLSVTASLHRRGHAQRLMHAAEAVPHEVEGDGCRVVLDGLAENVRQTGEPTRRGLRRGPPTLSCAQSFTGSVRPTRCLNSRAF